MWKSGQVENANDCEYLLANRVGFRSKKALSIKTAKHTYSILF